MARARASLAVSEPEFDEAWREEPITVPRTPAARLAAEPESYEAPDGTGVPGRRTVTIRGQVAPRPADRRPRRDPYKRAGSHPDRIAMWAVLLGLLLVLVAATSSHAATLRAPHAAHVRSAHVVALRAAPRQY
jgi:hypothetical protein